MITFFPVLLFKKIESLFKKDGRPGQIFPPLTEKLRITVVPDRFMSENCP
jgi:hypothetical protein